ncbi:MAG: YncE family protein, partial [Desulfobaccales bacterium]
MRKLLFLERLTKKFRLRAWLFAVTLLGLATLMAALNAHAIEFIGNPIIVGKNPRRVVIMPNGSEVYVSNRGDNTVSIINTKTNKVIKQINNVGKEPEALAISKDGKRVYVGQLTGVSVINTETKRLITTINTDGPVRDLAINPINGQKLYLAMEYNGLGKIEITPDGNYAYSVIDRTSCPEAVVFTPDGKRAYVNYQCAPSPGSWGHDPIFVFDADNDQRIAEIFHFPDGTRIANVGSFMAMSSNGRFIWADGIDACSRKKTDADPKGYDFEGCPPLNPGEKWEGRGIIN